MQTWSGEPLKLFRGWFEDAVKAGIPKPEAMALSTADRRGRPSSRMVLMKAVDGHGITFFTNYQSRKGGELAANPRAALLFFWDALNRQVRVEGKVSRVTAEESDDYWQTRPRGSQLSASISPQSRVIASRRVLEAAVAKLERLTHGQHLARPSHWGGYLLVPERVEFWTAREDRLHDRLLYTRKATGWKKEVLAP
jgi:pyridoxamine 5'-phosphate oxidase